MKKVSRVWAGILALLMVLTFMPGTAFAAGTSSDKVNVTLSAGAKDSYPAVYENVEATGDLAETYFPAVKDSEPEGVSLFDVLVAYHIGKYGKDKVTDYLQFAEQWGTFAITKAFGIENSSIMTVVNGEFTSTTNPSVKDGDKIYEGFYQDTASWADFYGAFENAEYSVSAGEELELKVTANSYGTAIVPSELAVYTVDQETGEKTEVTTAYSEGIAKVTFNKPGTYYVIPVGNGTYQGYSGETTGPVNGDVSKVTVKKPSVKKVTLSKVTAGKKKIDVKWKKVSGASGYEVSYKTGKKSWKTLTVKTTKTTIKKLKKGSYKVRVRAFVKLDGTNYPGAWSKTKTVKVKK